MKNLGLLFNPFERITGRQALAWGLFSIVVSTVLGYFSGWHYHGMLHFGPAPCGQLWCHAVERMAVWLLPAAVFYVGGRVLSGKSVKALDVFGKVAFAQVPLVVIVALGFLPDMQRLKGVDPANISEVITQSWFAWAMVLSLFLLVIVVWVVVLMFNALKVSCRLSGVRAGIFFGVAMVCCEVALRYLIALCY